MTFTLLVSPPPPLYGVYWFSSYVRASLVPPVGVRLRSYALPVRYLRIITFCVCLLFVAAHTRSITFFGLLPRLPLPVLTRFIGSTLLRCPAVCCAHHTHTPRSFADCGYAILYYTRSCLAVRYILQFTPFHHVCFAPLPLLVYYYTRSLPPPPQLVWFSYSPLPRSAFALLVGFLRTVPPFTFIWFTITDVYTFTRRFRFFIWFPPITARFTPHTGCCSYSLPFPFVTRSACVWFPVGCVLRRRALRYGYLPHTYIPFAVCVNLTVFVAYLPRTHAAYHTPRVRLLIPV